MRAGVFLQVTDDAPHSRPDDHSSRQLVALTYDELSFPFVGQYAFRDETTFPEAECFLTAALDYPMLQFQYVKLIIVQHVVDGHCDVCRLVDLVAGFGRIAFRRRLRCYAKRRVAVYV